LLVKEAPMTRKATRRNARPTGKRTKELGLNKVTLRDLSIRKGDPKGGRAGPPPTSGRTTCA
jgi:hypothetical protein